MLTLTNPTMRIDESQTNPRNRKAQSCRRALGRLAISSAALICMSSVKGSNAFAVHTAPLQHAIKGHGDACGRQRDSQTALMYAPPNHPTTKTAPMVAQAFYSSSKTNRNPTKPRNHQNREPLSHSVLSSSDTLPSFPTAHGLLSPETVIRMEIMTSGATRDEAVDYFLRTYRKDGPMACLHMLSDPNILPRLTEAMRDIIQ